MKVLGVTLNSDCTFSSHVEEVAKKLRRKNWALSKLRQKGMKEEDLVEAYKSTIRPSAEYATPVWHSLLRISQSEHIKRQQPHKL